MSNRIESNYSNCSICLEQFKVSDNLLFKIMHRETVYFSHLAISELDELPEFVDLNFLEKCNHVFHKNCIQGWILSSKSSSCPLCRAHHCNNCSQPFSFGLKRVQLYYYPSEVKFLDSTYFVTTHSELINPFDQTPPSTESEKREALQIVACAKRDRAVSLARKEESLGIKVVRVILVISMVYFIVKSSERNKRKPIVLK